MKSDIPFEKFNQYVWETIVLPHDEGKEEMRTRFQREQEKFAEMEKITWQDFEDCTREEMEKIPLGWIYDWTHVVADYGKQGKVQALYERYNLTPLNGREYLMRFCPDYLLRIKEKSGGRDGK